MVQEEMIRKGPWTEHEDGQLLFYVNLFGDRRWDFIAKVSGLKRTGKSCRLRWVNYLHPGLKRGKMTPHEERLVLELHSKWGNRWSRIARKLPGRTDNEIKNYWRTHMRKKAQEKKRTTMSPASSSISNSSNSSSNSSNCSSNPHVDSMPMSETKERSFYDTGGLEMQVMTTARSGKNINAKATSNPTVNSQEEISMDEFWKGIGLLEEEGETITPVYDPYSDLASPIWDYNPDSLWMMMSTNNQEERNTTKMFNYPMSEQFGASLTDKCSSFI